MELHNLDTGHATHGFINSAVPSIVLYALSWLFIYFQTLTADIIWTWTWRGLSLISLLLIVYINWNKVKEIRKSKK